MDLTKYKEMDFSELADTLEEALQAVSAFGSDTDLPQSEEGIRSLWKELRAKHEAEPLTPAEAAYAKRRRTLRHLEDAYGKPSTKKRHVQQVMESLKKQDRKIAELEASERHAYFQSKKPPESPREVQSRMLYNLLGNIERAFKPVPATQRIGRLQWQLARPGSLSVKVIHGHYEAEQRSNPTLRYDIGRFEKAFSLDPKNHYTGIDGFNGYVIFTFHGTDKALMECAEVGNAAYVIYSGWEEWSRMDKQELIAEADRGGAVTRIIHRGDDWFDNIKLAVGF